MANQILGALKITNTPKLNFAIERALVSDTWYEKPRFEDNKWFQNLTTHKPLPLSSMIKQRNRIDPIYTNKQKDCFINTVCKEHRIAVREAMHKGDSFIVNLEKYRNVL